MAVASNAGKLLAHVSQQAMPSRPKPGIKANSSDAALLSENESQAESSLAVAQALWSRGNLSPLDALFSVTAIVKLVPTSGFGFIGNHLGHRLLKYADDTGVPVDAAEAEPTLTRLNTKPKSSIRQTEWKHDALLFKKNRQQAFIALQASSLNAPLEVVYNHCANGLKTGGKLISADLMKSNCGNADGQKGSGNPAVPAYYSVDEHVSALKSVGLEVDFRYDLTANFLAAVRRGLLQSLEMLEELCGFSGVNSNQRTGAFCVQLEIWKKMYDLAAAQRIEAIGILATQMK